MADAMYDPRTHLTRKQKILVEIREATLCLLWLVPVFLVWLYELIT